MGDAGVDNPRIVQVGIDRENRGSPEFLFNSLAPCCQIPAEDPDGAVLLPATVLFVFAPMPGPC